MKKEKSKVWPGVLIGFGCLIALTLSFFAVRFLFTFITDCSNETRSGKELALVKIHSISDGETGWEVIHDTGYKEKITDKDFKGKYKEKLSSEAEIFKLDSRCMSSRIVNGEIRNEVVPTVIDESSGMASKEGEIAKAVMHELASLEKHDIMGISLFKTDSLWFVDAELNVNLWDPYDFFVYHPEKNTLEPLCTWDNCEIEELYLIEE